MCDRVGLIGKCDVVQFLSGGTPFPIKYKHGPKRKWPNDDVQFAAQAIGLEEMLYRTVSKGQFFTLAATSDGKWRPGRNCDGWWKKPRRLGL